MAKYVDPILKMIVAILDKDGPADLKGRYGYGDPVVVNKSQLTKPIAFVSFDTEYSVSDTASAEIGSDMPIVIDVVTDMTRDFGQGLNAKSHLELIRLVCGRNDDLTLMKDSIIGALRANQDPGQRVWINAGERTTVEFEGTPRDKGLVTAEALVRFTVKHSQFVPDLV